MSKSLEDYLLTYEERLITQLNDTFVNQNKNFFILYVLTATYILFESGLVGTITIFGVEIKLNAEHFRLFVPYLFLIIYVFINFQIIKISKLLISIRLNGNAILKENINARPLKIDDIYYYSKGFTGVVLVFAKWQFSIMVNKISLSRLKRALKSRTVRQFLWKLLLYLINVLWWGLISLIRFLLLAFLFVLPIIVIFYLVVTVPSIYFKSIHTVSLIILGATFIATILSIGKLFSIFLFELRENLNEKIDGELENLGEVVYDIFMAGLKKLGYILKD